MDSQSSTFEYGGLFGSEFVERARENRDAATLEAIWRLREPSATRMVAGPLASLGLPRLSDLLLEEAIEASLGPQVAETVLGAVREHFPPLSSQGVVRLGGWLRDNDPAATGYTPAREVLEVWLLRQEHADADAFALDALSDELGYAFGDSCRAAALKRCREDSALAGRVATRLEAALAEEPDPGSWEAGADFVEAMTLERRPPSYLGPLTDRLVTEAAEQAQVDEFTEDLQRAMVGPSAPVLKKILAGDPLADALGSRAVVSLHNYLRRPQERAKAFIDVLDRQTSVWRTVGRAITAAWDTEEWARRLAAVQRSDRAFHEDLLVALMTAAPSAHAALVVQIAVDRADDPEDSLVTAAGSKLGELVTADLRDDEETSSDHEGSDIPWWPSERPPVRLRIFDAILRAAIPDADNRIPRVMEAFTDGKLSAPEASHLIDAEEFRTALQHLDLGEQRRNLATELSDRDEESLIEAVRDIHSEGGFQLDLAEAVASRSAETAFMGAGDVYSDLGETDRGKLLSLLETHGRAEDVSTLDVIVQDTRAANAEYRRRAALRIGEVTAEGVTLPSSVVELLRSNLPELVDASAAVIGRVKPEDPSLIRLLRSVAIDSGEESEARAALNSLADAFADRLTPELSKETRVHLLNLLAAAATASVADPLLSHIGREALDDDPEVRRVAASGLKEVASQGSLDASQLARLVRVIEEERDPSAKEDLQAAVTRASLGEDAALEVLHELLPFTPKHGLGDLLGAERERVVRHLQLLATERERGEQGRPGVIMQLDIIAERILRVAYLRFGQSDRLKTEIRASSRTPDYGSLIQALSGVRELQRIQGRLHTLHSVRSERTEFTHSGEAPSPEDEATAWTCFADGVKVMISSLDQD